MTQHAADPRTPAPAADAAWAWVLARDHRGDGLFVYAVRTTGIYCRPSCTSRRPRRENVVFFQSTEEAERSGFRPCKRCRPQTERASATERALWRALELIEAEPARSFSLEELARAVGLSAAYFQKVFLKHVGVSPREYQRARKIALLKDRLRSGETVGRAQYAAGFNSSRSLYEQGEADLGMTPGRYREGGAGVTIRYTTAATELGQLLVAATDQGICAVSLGDRAQELEDALRAEFAAADLRRDEGSLADALALVLAMLQGTPPSRALPLDLRGTAFQLRVWKALREIPFGQTRSYAQVAEAIGAPGSARAVARACAGNRVALLVPCHRVVRADGGVSGYRWGAERKRAILEREAGGG